MTFRAALFAASIVVALGHSAEAAPVSYTSIYQPTALPAESPATPGGLYWDVVSNGSSSANVSGGVLSVNTMPSTSTTRAWRVGTQDSSVYGSSSAWNITPGGSATIDFILKVTGSSGPAVGSPQILGGFNLSASTGSHEVLISFSSTQIHFQAGANYYHSFNNTVENTFRLVLDNNQFSLYALGRSTPFIHKTQMRATTGLNQLVWGDNQPAVSGAFDLSFMGWNNRVAEFSIPEGIVIPEPSMAALGLLSGGLLLFIKRRRS